MSPPVLRTIAVLLHEKLTGSSYLVHWFDGSISALLACGLRFESGRQLVIRNGPDGVTLIVEEAELAEMDMEQYGQTKLVSSLSYDPARSQPCLGSSFDSCRVVVSPTDQLLAIELEFGGRTISFYNEDDELITARSIDERPEYEGRLVDIAALG